MGGNIRSSHRDGFSKHLFFFSRSNLCYNFPEEFICSSDGHVFFPEGSIYSMFFEQTKIFQEDLPKRHVFQGGSLFLLFYRTDTNSSRNPYLVLEYIRIFQERLYFLVEQIFIVMEALSSFEHIIFSRRLCCMLRADRNFPGRYLPPPLSYYLFVYFQGIAPISSNIKHGIFYIFPFCLSKKYQLSRRRG